MIHNDVLRSVRYMLDISDNKMVEIIKLGGMEVTKDGLVIFKRGKDESRPPQPIETPVTNNIILKKLRVAFELKEDDMHAILKAAEFPVSKPELSALFRKFGHTNYRPCGDQLLRNFLKGLTLRVRA